MKADSLHPVIETSVNEGRKMVVDDGVYPLDENGILPFKEFMTGIRPLLNCLFDQRSSNNKWIVVREFPCLCPTIP